MKPTKFGSGKNPFAKVVKKAAGGITKASRADSPEAPDEMLVGARGDEPMAKRMKDFGYTEPRASSAGKSGKAPPSPTPIVKKAAGGDTTSFGKAFAAARRDNPGKNFTWNGKSYTTELKGNAATKGSASPAAKPSSAGDDNKLDSLIAAERKSRPPVYGANTQAAIDKFNSVKSGGRRLPGMVAADPERRSSTDYNTIDPEDNRSFTDKLAGSVPEGGLAKGGTFRSSANGAASKGKTKAAMPKMAKGGSIDGIAQRGKTRGCK